MFQTTNQMGVLGDKNGGKEPMKSSLNKRKEHGWNWKEWERFVETRVTWENTFSLLGPDTLKETLVFCPKVFGCHIYQGRSRAADLENRGSSNLQQETRRVFPLEIGVSNPVDDSSMKIEMDTKKDHPFGLKSWKPRCMTICIIKA